MNNLPKNKNILIAGAAVIILILLAGYFLLFNKSQVANQQTNNTTEIPVLTIKPEDIGLTLVQDASGNKATLKITKTDDITSIEYELSYSADADGERVPRGIIGDVDIKTPGQVITHEIIYGTCSDVCHYDKDVEDVKIIVKLTKTDGKIYQAEITPSN